MTSGDERRAMPPSEPARTDDPPYGEESPNLFRPVSIENRITGEGSRRRAQDRYHYSQAYSQSFYIFFAAALQAFVLSLSPALFNRRVSVVFFHFISPGVKLLFRHDFTI